MAQSKHFKKITNDKSQIKNEYYTLDIIKSYAPILIQYPKILWFGILNVQEIYKNYFQNCFQWAF